MSMASRKSATRSSLVKPVKAWSCAAAVSPDDSRMAAMPVLSLSFILILFDVGVFLAAGSDQLQYSFVPDDHHALPVFSNSFFQFVSVFRHHAFHHGRHVSELDI